MEQSDAVWRKLRHPHTIQIRPCSLIPTTTLAFPALLCLRTALHRFHRPHPTTPSPPPAFAHPSTRTHCTASYA